MSRISFGIVSVTSVIARMTESTFPPTIAAIEPKVIAMIVENERREDRRR